MQLLSKGGRRQLGVHMYDRTRDHDGVYIEAGEDASPNRTFSVDQIAEAFDVARDRVVRAIAGEFDLGPESSLTSRNAQDLVEVLLGDLPIDQREAALMKLGAFTPRSDADWGLGSGPPDEESDRQSAEAGTPDDDLPNKRSSHAPSTQSSN